MKCDSCGAHARDDAQLKMANVSMYDTAAKEITRNTGWAIVSVAIMAQLPESAFSLTDEREYLPVRSCIDLCSICLAKALGAVDCANKVQTKHPEPKEDDRTLAHMRMMRMIPRDIGGFNKEPLGVDTGSLK
jgi:hypothetical protein